MTDSAINRRRFLTAAALNAGAAALPGGLLSGRSVAAVPPQITLPERGIHDTSPATSWTDGFLTGNGDYGAVLHGAPTLEKVVFNYQRLVLPNGTRDVTPPVISGRLEGARDKALAGDYAGANRDFAAGWSLRWTQASHPAYELHIDTPGMTTVNDYARVTDFRTGEVSCAGRRQVRTASPPPSVAYGIHVRPASSAGPRAAGSRRHAVSTSPARTGCDLPPPARRRNTSQSPSARSQ
ncbi:glycoside hydrolase N-terminal domain-containing protein [Streptomyces sp. NPDC001250]|uniref:glycoside hydrolase N-terminal domain-containing protein n=1 Tax=unclassified Streptomyces TaxID=2593676 RepID=UPI00332B4678